ncbi:MAG: ribonuclease H-like domain-containing protein, partial [Bacteroidia bacterium]
MAFVPPKIINVLFLDIETVPVTYRYQDLSDSAKELWNKKWAFKKENDPEELYAKAGIYAEFSKIVCIGLGYYSYSDFRVKAIAGDNEEEILNEFVKIVSQFFNKPDEHFFCAHNGKEFDYPFLSRRMLVNGVPFPKNFQLQGLKPWEVKHLDTMEMWRFGDVKNFTSLNLLAHAFGLPSPKDEMDGSEVGKVYYEEKNIE